MTYLQFHGVFTLPLLVVLVAWSVVAIRAGRSLIGWPGFSNRFAWIALALHVAIALVYTTPWDNYLVSQEVWGYPEGRVLFVIGFVPFEEYLFFLVQTLITGLWLYALTRSARRTSSREQPFSLGTTVVVRLSGAVGLLLLAGAGVVLLGAEQGTYLGLILVWAAPVLALQWGFGGDLIVARWRVVVPAVALSTAYLWVADRIAIDLGIWWISETSTTGIKAFGLPLEEAAFFLVTNLLVGFGLTLALHRASLARLQRLWAARGGWWRLPLGLWAVSMIPTPLLPAEAFPLLAYLSTTLLAVGVFGFAYSRYGSRAWLLFVAAFGFGLGVEWLGSTTGVPFGYYRYTAPGPTLLGVPVLVPLGWWAFTMIAVSMRAGRWSRWLAPAALVAWDFGLDPLMVSRGFWVFEPVGAYFGIPVSNFLGWYLAGFVLVLLLQRLEPRLSQQVVPELRLVFLIQAFLMTVGLAYFGLPVAALVTLVAMGGIWLLTLSPQRKASLEHHS